MIKFKFLSILALLCITASSAWALDGSGTPEDPYLIKVSQDWWDFADGVNNGTYSSSCAKLMINIGSTQTLPTLRPSRLAVSSGGWNQVH